MHACTHATTRLCTKSKDKKGEKKKIKLKQNSIFARAREKKKTRKRKMGNHDAAQNAQHTHVRITKQITTSCPPNMPLTSMTQTNGKKKKGINAIDPSIPPVPYTCVPYVRPRVPRFFFLVCLDPGCRICEIHEHRFNRSKTRVVCVQSVCRLKDNRNKSKKTNKRQESHKL